MVSWLARSKIALIAALFQDFSDTAGRENRPGPPKSHRLFGVVAAKTAF
jgi:hypothetical protein